MRLGDHFPHRSPRLVGEGQGGILSAARAAGGGFRRPIGGRLCRLGIGTVDSYLTWKFYMGSGKTSFLHKQVVLHFHVSWRRPIFYYLGLQLASEKVFEV